MKRLKDNIRGYNFADFTKKLYHKCDRTNIDDNQVRRIFYYTQKSKNEFILESQAINIKDYHTFKKQIQFICNADGFYNIAGVEKIMK